ncbi:TIGR01777 family oxidoreductase [Sedimenticola thiotaurini]|uniref:Epimerase n=1 Tax=Sedimenticola thiotaurini TaxID=1543721 RepID=A0A0F7JV18_9GAMM|nr:TIGR01777 family oxidoreductase [Sedimenticola thiotaurini]AKH19164.1 epimerase [Sedimenticola thiotaurini]
MKIAITGATGFIGRRLCTALNSAGHQLIQLGRQALQDDIDRLAGQLQGCDAIINLAGENIGRRWSEAYMQALYDSRVLTTRALVEALSRLEQRPGLLISTSAMGAFDSLGRYSESDPPNAGGFFGRLTRDWEAAALQAETLGVRTLIFRLSLVLGRDGGMMKQLLLPFRLGLGGPIGDGSQPFSWIHIDDLVRAYSFALAQPEMGGIYHLSAPDSTTNRQFTRTLGRQLHRPALLPVPLFMLKLRFGQGAEALASGQYLISERLPEAGFHFQYDTLAKALQEITGPA